MADWFESNSPAQDPNARSGSFDYGNGIVGRQGPDGKWYYPWRSQGYDNMLSDTDVQQQQDIGAFRSQNGDATAADDAGALAQMRGEAPLTSWGGAPDAPQSQPGTLSGMVGGGYQSPAGLSGDGGMRRPQVEPFAFDASKLGQTEGFKFNFDNAMRAIDRSAAAKGKSFTNDTREELMRTASGLASQDINAEYGRQADTFGINANRSDTAFNQNRTTQQDSRAWDTDLWNRDRTTQNDQWGRGLDTWNVNRSNQNDQFDQSYKLSDLILARRPRPA